MVEKFYRAMQNAFTCEYADKISQWVNRLGCVKMLVATALAIASYIKKIHAPEKWEVRATPRRHRSKMNMHVKTPQGNTLTIFARRTDTKTKLFARVQRQIMRYQGVP